MANGELLLEVQQILRREKEIPDISPKALSQLTLAAQIHLYEELHKLSKRVSDLEGIAADLVEDKVRRDEQKTIPRLEALERAVANLAQQISLHTEQEEVKKQKEEQRKEKVEDAHLELKFGVIGTVIGILASTIVQIIVRALGLL